MLSGLESVAFTLGVMASYGDTKAVNDWQNAILRTANFDQPAAITSVIPVQFAGQLLLSGLSKMPIWEFMQIQGILPDVSAAMKDATWYMMAGQVKVGHNEGGRPDDFVGVNYNPINGGNSVPVFRSSFYGYSTGFSFYPVTHNELTNVSGNDWNVFYEFSGSVLTYKETI